MELELGCHLISVIKLVIGLDSSSIARARTKGKLILDLNKENLNGAWRKKIIVLALLLQSWLWESMNRQGEDSRHRQKHRWFVLIWYVAASLSWASCRTSFTVLGYH